MIVRYPGECLVDGLRWVDEIVEAAHFARAIGGQVVLNANPDTGRPFAEWKRRRAVTWREFDCDVNYVAPKWIAWLYRWLPHSIGWYGKQYDSVDFAPFFLWSLHAYKWSIGWLPKRRAQRYGPMRLGVLRYNERVLTL